METHLSDTRFDSLELAEPLRQALNEAGYTHCTPIQEKTLPLALQGRDVAGQAQTGTGKTAAFLLALFHRLLTRPAAEDRRPNQPRALVLAPTRELAVQIHKDAEQLGKHTGLKLGLVYGGAGYEQQRQQLEDGVDVLIGTPGRLIDYFKQRVFDLRAAQVAVLDEADRMFDMGFIKDIRFILRKLPHPEKRLNMLFSATLSYRVMELAYEHMNNPESVKVDADQVTADRVRQMVYMPASEEKVRLLVGLLRRIDPSRTMIFVNMKRTAEELVAWLKGNDYQAEVLSGDVPQRKRLSLLKQFETGELPILITTDVAARGLHIPDVSHVINYDLPEDPEDYVHRIGRTARAGAEGDAISFACDTYAMALPDIEAYIEQQLPKEVQHDELLVELKPQAEVKRRPGGPRKKGGGKGGPRGGQRGSNRGGRGGGRRPGGNRSGGGGRPGGGNRGGGGNEG
ncbi:ATP-dependent RNA helicase RhlB [Natronospira bacteriovora]|uniref:ATP-dependent RNA helicase RhlB n=1 Tax=Natronospira bacteriovora TaxID=3069753 RepID=A0ABU0W6L3_9GAMM|nr:ATP-dependent RNA helicase RhlB [Natronospira sp. AB-CW4]MDQ2069649.1 ATP-dependent RNA helicase RhlB [Natronospira sp. AB-CW4]